MIIRRINLMFNLFKRRDIHEGSRKGKLTIKQFNILRDIAMKTGLEIGVADLSYANIISENFELVDGKNITVFDVLVGMVFNQRRFQNDGTHFGISSNACNSFPRFWNCKCTSAGSEGIISPK